ncbi:MAG: hypothetical protein ACYCS1_09980 [Gammaproteobacteria bacterium]
MLNPNDLYTYQDIVPMKEINSGTIFGTSIIQYSFRKYIDNQNLKNVLSYVLHCKHRIIIPNANDYSPGPNSEQKYENYPAIVTNSIQIEAPDGAALNLRQIFPKTLNSSVNTSLSQQSGSTSSNSVQSTNGSNMSQTNTFGVNVSAGIFGELPVFNIGADYSHGWESGSSSSKTSGSDTSRQNGSSSDESMSIKDWSSYGYVDNKAQKPSWIWGQSYPWDVIQYNYSADDGLTISLPSFIKARMTDDIRVFPPSQLSLFGVDFTMTASWLISFPQGITSPEKVRLSHSMTCYTASHSLSGATLVSHLQDKNDAATAEYQSPSMEMSTYALEPLLSADAKNGAAVGFTVNPFIYPPTTHSSEFKIVSAANNLQVTGTGFDSSMNADFSVIPSLTVNFKVLDTTNDYSFLFMSWIGSNSSACKLTVTINTRYTVTVYVDATEGQGGQNNVTTVELRNTDFTSINFHDYLVLGLNQVVVTAAPADSTVPNQYALFAMAIGQG